MSKAYKKRPEDFRRKILEYYNGKDRLELHALEQKWLDKIKDSELCIASNKSAGTIRYYNMKKKARGLGGIFASELRRAYWASEAGKEHKLRLSIETTKRNQERRGKGTIPWNKGLKCPSISTGRLANPIKYSEEQIEANRERSKNLWKDPEYQAKMLLRKKPDPAKIAESLRGKRHSDETKAKMSISAKKAKTKTKEHKEALSVAAQNRAAQILTCPHCGFSGSATGVKRWHFRNCKFTIV